MKFTRCLFVPKTEYFPHSLSLPIDKYVFSFNFFVLCSFPLENELEGPNRRVLQIIEGLAALGHDVLFVSFSSKLPEFARELKTSKGAVDWNKWGFLVGSFNMSGVSLLERADNIRISLTPINGKGIFLPHQ